MDSISKKIQALLTSPSRENQVLGWLLDKTQNKGRIRESLVQEHADLLNPTSGWTIETLIGAKQVVCNYKITRQIHIKNLPLMNSFSCQKHVQLQSLRISNCPKLEHLHCCYNENLKSLIIDNCPKLLYLNCEKNQLSSLSITNAPKLIHLYATNNQLDTFDLSLFPDLFTAQFTKNPIQTLKVSFEQYEHLNPRVETFTKVII